MKKDEEMFQASAEELEDVMNAAKAHAKKWGRSDAVTFAVFAEFLRQVQEFAQGKVPTDSN